jgi:hypothetical protein
MPLGGRLCREDVSRKACVDSVNADGATEVLRKNGTKLRIKEVVAGSS